MQSVVFVRRINPDGSQTSSCQGCLDVVATAVAERALKAAENLHVCNFSELSDSVLSGYMTLTERVLMFLKVHDA